MKIDVIRRDGLKAAPWKNGGGETREIACFPPGSSITDFAWRLSMATVAQDGAFSVFEGIDRRLHLLEGAGLVLRMGSGETIELRPGDHVAFRGELPVHGSLADSPVVDFNIMLRRDKQRAQIGERKIAGAATLNFPQKTTAIFVRRGRISITHPVTDVVARAFDTIIVETAHASCMSVSGDADIIMIGFDPL